MARRAAPLPITWHHRCSPYGCAVTSRAIGFPTPTPGRTGHWRGEPREASLGRRMTNLFADPLPREVTVNAQQRFLEEGLIHRTERGDLVRSKSELVIADKLHARGIDYAYEQPLVLPNGRTRYPDFTIRGSRARRDVLLGASRHARRPGVQRPMGGEACRVPEVRNRASRGRWRPGGNADRNPRRAGREAGRSVDSQSLSLLAASRYGFHGLSMFSPRCPMVVVPIQPRSSLRSIHVI